MTEDLKKRLIGAAVLVSLAVIFIPMLIEEEHTDDHRIYLSNIPKQPQQLEHHQFPADEVIDTTVNDLAYNQSSIQPDETSKVTDLNTSDAQQQVAEQTEQAPVKPRVGLTSWMVQVASFSSQDNAQKVVKQLRDAGYDTHLESAEVKKLKVFRVRIGPEISRKNADRIAGEISKKFFYKPKVIKYP